MKLSLILLLCLVAATYQHQQQQYNNYRFFSDPRWAFYYPVLGGYQDIYAQVIAIKYDFLTIFSYIFYNFD